jgi:hypothetical protein
VTPDERQPWELADESGRPRKKVPPTSKPIEEEEERDDVEPRTRGNGSPSWNEEEDDAAVKKKKEEEASRYADEDAEEHSDPKGPAGAAGGPR